MIDFISLNHSFLRSVVPEIAKNMFKIYLYEYSVKFWLLQLYIGISLSSFFFEIILRKNIFVTILKDLAVSSYIFFIPITFLKSSYYLSYSCFSLYFPYICVLQKWKKSHKQS